ncbi:MAG TPA: methylmalonyl-CoA mutase family protein, partial [Bacteroidales bacterium]|nr:methylmalonyl-CoA mutase family protein [Bacteroidales bacterium]
MNEQDNSARLFSEFPPVSTQVWEEAIRKDLKGADYNKKMVWHTEQGFSVNPYYREEDIKEMASPSSLPGEFPFVRGNRIDNNWYVRQN